MTNKNSILNEPFLLAPAGIEKIWGGTRLKSGYNKKSDADPLAESWECSTHASGLSYVASGTYAGKSLMEVIKTYPQILGSNHCEIQDLPILVKLIDAEQDLSVQVHPDDEFALINENGSHGKHEMWYVLEANRNSKLVYGLNHRVDKKTILNSIMDNTIKNYLQYVKVKKGDVFFIKPGTIHAIGEGVLLAEIQQNSNITYRLYDYNRVDKFGNKRELHIDKALQVADLKVANFPRQPMRVLKYSTNCASELLYRCRYFQVERILLNNDGNSSLEFSSGPTSFWVFLCILGSGVMRYDLNRDIMYKKGDCIFIPANSVNFTLLGKSEILKISC